jgi:hypothetical protein
VHPEPPWRDAGEALEVRAEDALVMDASVRHESDSPTMVQPQSN